MQCLLKVVQLLDLKDALNIIALIFLEEIDKNLIYSGLEINEKV